LPGGRTGEIIKDDALLLGERGWHAGKEKNETGEDRCRTLSAMPQSHLSPDSARSPFPRSVASGVPAPDITVVLRF
jgi:hypothetical protein